MRLPRILALLPCLGLLSGCHSPYVEVTISNRTTHSIDLIEVDYPSASFGTQGLAPGADFHYRFKVLGSGDMNLTYTDTAHHEQKSKGPFLREGTEGPIIIAIATDGTLWQAAFTSKP